MIKEWDMLRVVACLSIVVLHVTTWIVMTVEKAPEHEFYMFLRIALCFATPTFIVLSTILLANRYREKVPPGFWSSRLQFVFVPFLVWSFVDALIIEMIYQNGLLWKKYLNNILYGRFVGWFVVVIMQLYVIFTLMKRFKWSPAWFLPICVIVSLIHQAVIALPYPIIEENIAIMRLLFTGWLGYFALAYLMGMYYSQVAALAKRYRLATIVFVILSGAFLYIRMQLGYTEIHSRRLDLVPLVVSIILFVIA
ncbi:MAG: acyltransferase family protein [Lysinibacillus sp.]